MFKKIAGIAVFAAIIGGFTAPAKAEIKILQQGTFRTLSDQEVTEHSHEWDVPKTTTGQSAQSMCVDSTLIDAGNNNVKLKFAQTMYQCDDTSNVLTLAWTYQGKYIIRWNMVGGGYAYLEQVPDAFNGQVTAQLVGLQGSLNQVNTGIAGLSTGVAQTNNQVAGVMQQNTELKQLLTVMITKDQLVTACKKDVAKSNYGKDTNRNYLDLLTNTLLSLKKGYNGQQDHRYHTMEQWVSTLAIGQNTNADMSCDGDLLMRDMLAKLN